MNINIIETGFSEEELESAKHLGREFESFFQTQTCEGEICLMNVQLPAGFPERDIDILVLLKIEEGSIVKFESKGFIVEMVGGFIFNIETKSHSNFELQGNHILVKYPGGIKKDATKQAWNVKNNLLTYLKKVTAEMCPGYST